MRGKICIAIDGPAGAGKSSVAKLVANRLSYVYIDTGAMYRALTWKAMKNNMNLENGSVMRGLLEDVLIELVPDGEVQLVLLNHEDVTDCIRSEEVSNHVSIVARHQEVREEMVKRQRFFARGGGVAMDGRDIGTHVLPKAEVKIFLWASVEVRARRRHLENMKKGMESDLEQMTADIALRDQRDTERKTSPLVKAEDAIEIDTTELTVGEVADTILGVVAERTE